MNETRINVQETHGACRIERPLIIVEKQQFAIKWNDKNNNRKITDGFCRAAEVLV